MADAVNPNGPLGILRDTMGLPPKQDEPPSMIAKVRQSHPEYGDLSDQQLADGLYRKFYSDMPREAFDAKVGVKATSAAPMEIKADTGTTEDVAKSAGTGLVRGVAGVLGLPGAIKQGMDWGVGKLFDLAGAPAPDPRGVAIRDKFSPPTPEDIRNAGTALTGINLYEPQTTAGKYAKTVGEFVPGALAGPGGALSNVVKFGVLPGLASEAAGQATEGTGLEPFARAGAALTTGGAAALLSRPSTAAQALQKNLPAGLKEADITAAESLIGQSTAQGIPITWPEALAQVTGRRVDMTDVQRFLEQSRGGRGEMSQFMAERTAGVEPAFQKAAADLRGGASTGSPAATGLTVQKVAEDSLDGARKALNAATEPLYTKGGTAMLDDATYRNLIKDPLVKDAIKKVADDPVRSRFVVGYPPRSVRYLDQVKKVLDDAAGSAGTRGENAAASVYGGVAADVRGAATGASPEYAQALATQANVRQNVLAPAENSALGKIAATPDLKAQGNALLPSAPLSGSQVEVDRTVRLLARRDPVAASRLVASHVESVFSEATQSLVGGGNQWGAAKFVAAIRGNRQQAKNLEVAVQALPMGNARWEGFKRLLETMEATGKRQHAGSGTEFNAQMRGSLERGSLGGTPAALASSPGAAMTAVRDFYRDFRLGKNTAAMAKILTDPQAGPLFRQLLSAGSPNDRLKAASALVNLGAQPLTQPAK